MTATVYKTFSAAAETHPELPFLCIPPCADRDYLPAGAEFSYGRAEQLVQSLAARYTSAGYREGHRVALVLGNRPDHFWHLLALNSIDACAITLNPDYLPHELSYALTKAEASLVVTSTACLSKVREAAADASSCPVAVQEDGDIHLPPPARLPKVVSANAGDREALVIFTSGTTSRPKGCIISNRSCIASGTSYVTAGGALSLEPRAERLFVPLPTFHMNASVLALNAMLQRQGCIVLPDRFRASSWWADLKNSRATCLHYLGLIPPVLLKAPPSDGDKDHGIKFGLGAGVDPTLHGLFEERFGFPLVEVWGMTETSRMIANTHEPRLTATRAFGRPKPPLQVRVVDDAGADVRPGEPGELLVRAEGEDPRSGFFSGYVNDDAATETAWHGGWFHTGDVVSQDESGMLFFVERRKNLIRRSGENIAAAEVEETIIVDDAVRAVAVIAVPDEMRDEEPMACVVLGDGWSASEAVAARIVERARATLAPHKLPGWVAFVPSIPQTATQKARKEMIFPPGSDPRQCADVFDVRRLKQKRP